MIQRPQTVYLLMCFLAFLIALFLPIATYILNEESSYVLTAFGVKAVETSLTDVSIALKPFYAAPFILFLTLYALTRFKNRKLQLKLVHFNYLLILAYILTMYFALDSTEKALESVVKSVKHDAGFYLPVVAVAFNFLAARGIKKDEELVRSIDRIR
ncbi:MAG: DUF4293 domain-containing protein [Luteibaculaceae bacterium]